MSRAIKILLDAGHYAHYNRSPVVKDYWESKQMWKLHLYLKEELEQYGFEVAVTRAEQEKDMPVTKRGLMAKGCDMLISLHSNAANSESVDRVDIYAPYDNISNSHLFANALSQTIARVMGTNQKGFVKTRKSQKGDWEYYGILRGAREAGCKFYYIAEHSFHTNKRSAAWLLNDDNLKKLARAEADLIGNYYRKTKKSRPGDINGDGAVDIFDYAEAKNALLGNQSLSEEQKKVADINGDGCFDIFDCMEIKKKSIQ